jgi:hypothetical protein
MPDNAQEDAQYSRRGSKPDTGLQRLNAAFDRAAREQEELRRLKASGAPFACIDFVGAFGYED